MHDVRVNLSPPYPILIDGGLLKRIGQMAILGLGKKVGVVIDANIFDSHGQTLLRSLADAKIEALHVILQPGEQHKTITDILPAYDRFLGAKIERRTPIISLGGGMITDMGGFIAATLLRGLPLIQVPTTLLAMVDASVGGKTGVNHAMGKNLIGAFHQPSCVLIDPQTLRTLPARELRSGLAECIKHEIIRDADGFADLERNLPRALDLDMEYLELLITHNVTIKARVVEADPFEKGERAHLNFGHTFGHAIETIFDYAYSHGECVALGMVAASRLAVELKMLDTIALERIINLIKRAELPVGGLKIDDLDRVLDAMFFDKKVSSGKLRFILPDRIGHVVIRADVPYPLVRQALQSLRG